MRRFFQWLRGLHFHKWEQSRPFDGTEGFPAPWESHEWTRTCKVCGKEQRWLPGYGGSEWGCWL